MVVGVGEAPRSAKLANGTHNPPNTPRDHFKKKIFDGFMDFCLIEDKFLFGSYFPVPVLFLFTGGG